MRVAARPDSSTPSPVRRLARRGAALAGTLALAAGAVVLSSSSASAVPVNCWNNGGPKDLGMSTNCAQVTGIDAGSSLVLHNGPSYASGVQVNSPHYSNGTWLGVYCWTTGSGDADGHGDTYWFNVDDGNGNIGWVNDWYLTTGGYAQWSPIVQHC
ncbi:MAG TPA: hypothetical protein VGL02_16015 [Streptomyces sp.]